MEEEKRDLVTVDGLKNESKWFAELSSMWPGQALALQYERVLVHERSKYQDVLMLETAKYGKTLVLDGVVQVTQRDQFSYAEMIAHLPLFAHPNPRDVVMIGGGDGAVLCEVLKHESVRSVTICEIDEKVIEVSKEYYPEYAYIWEHPKLTTHIGDGAAFMETHKESFDVAIVDSSDPVGPASVLFGEKFYRILHAALRPGGVACSQGECMWLHLPLIGEMLEFCRRLFKRATYAYTTIPTYPSGQIGFILCSKGPTLREAKRTVEEALVPCFRESLRYYSEEIHGAAFVLPPFVKRVVYPRGATQQREKAQGKGKKGGKQKKGKKSGKKR